MCKLQGLCVVVFRSIEDPDPVGSIRLPEEIIDLISRGASFLCSPVCPMSSIFRLTRRIYRRIESCPELATTPLSSNIIAHINNP